MLPQLRSHFHTLKVTVTLTHNSYKQARSWSLIFFPECFTDLKLITIFIKKEDRD